MPRRPKVRSGLARGAVVAVAVVALVMVAAGLGTPPPDPEGAAAAPATTAAAAVPVAAASPQIPDRGGDAREDLTGSTPRTRAAAPAAATGTDVLSFGSAVDHGSTSAGELDPPIVALAGTPSGGGYWEVATNGEVFAFGDAVSHGSTGALNRPIVGIAATPTGNGYWLTASDGGIFSFGDATYHGSTGNVTLNRPIVAIAATPTGNGYWLTASDGGIFSFGDATFHGSAAGTDLGVRSVVAMVAVPEGGGYWLVVGRTRLELPRGGRVLFPDWRVVAHYGGPQSPRLGILGEGTPAEAARRAVEQAAAYEGYGRPVLPAFELLATIATSAPGRDGDYSSPLADSEIQRYLDAARANGMLLILDLQPGRAGFLEEAKRFERFLREPDVGLALDPEWSVRAPAAPGGGTIGSTDAATINGVSAWLADLVAEEGLPEKLLVVHQFTERMVRDRHLVVDRPGIATTFHIDGFGGQFAKRSKYQQLRPEPPFATGFKLFYDEDTDLLTPDEVMTTLSPPPDLVTHQ